MSAVQLHGQTIDYDRAALPQLHAATPRRACHLERTPPLTPPPPSGPARPLTRTPSPALGHHPVTEPGSHRVRK